MSYLGHAYAKQLFPSKVTLVRNGGRGREKGPDVVLFLTGSEARGVWPGPSLYWERWSPTMPSASTPRWKLQVSPIKVLRNLHDCHVSPSISVLGQKGHGAEERWTASLGWCRCHLHSWVQGLEPASAEHLPTGPLEAMGLSCMS
jgi:hypothetical protein